MRMKGNCVKDRASELGPAVSLDQLLAFTVERWAVAGLQCSAEMVGWCKPVTPATTETETGALCIGDEPGQQSSKEVLSAPK